MARYYEEEFKRQIVELKKRGRKTADLVKEYGVSKTTITQWEKEFNNKWEFWKKSKHKRRRKRTEAITKRA